LLELLVVIAVIAILAGLLLPALKTARDRGMTLSCLNKEKQLFLVFMSYADDYGQLPASYSDTVAPYRWYDFLSHAGYTPHYSKTPYWYSCPLFSTPSVDYTMNYMASWNQYGDGYFGGGRLDRVPMPGKTFLLADGDYMFLNTNYYTKWRDSECRTRHSKGCNWVFMDGHAEWHAVPYDLAAGVSGYIPVGATFTIPWGVKMYILRDGAWVLDYPGW